MPTFHYFEVKFEKKYLVKMGLSFVGSPLFQTKFNLIWYPQSWNYTTISAIIKVKDEIKRLILGTFDSFRIWTAWSDGYENRCLFWHLKYHQMSRLCVMYVNNEMSLINWTISGLDRQDLPALLKFIWQTFQTVHFSRNVKVYFRK